MTPRSVKWLYLFWTALAVVLLTCAAPTRAAETLTFIHTDVAGSPVAATDINGNVVWRESYRPYGERTRNQSAAGTNRQFFHGKEFDADTGLSYFGARYYDPVVGRFMGVDAVGFKEENLHSFNRYAYGNNNPYKYRDPDGNNAGTIIFLGLLGAGAYLAIGSYQATNLQAGLQGFPASNGSDSTILTTPGSTISGNQLPGFSQFVGKFANLIFNENRTPQEILAPGGRLIGQQGKSPGIRVLPGGTRAAQDLFDQLTKGGEVIDKPGYPGTLVELPSGGTVGIRPKSKSGDTAIDVNVPGLQGGVDKIHFPE